MRSSFRRIAFIAALAAPLSVASAQTPFGVGTKLLSVGLLGGGSTGYGIGVGGSFEAGVKEMTPQLTLGLGVFAGYTSKSYDYGFAPGYSYTWKTIPIAAVGNLHYKMADNPKLDLYGGLSLGFVHYSYSSDYAGFNSGSIGGSSDLALGINVGGRYDFTDNVGGFVQLSGGSHFPLYFLGVSFKM